MENSQQSKGAMMQEHANNDSHQYLTFVLDDEIFGLAIDKVREVLDFTTFTKVPRSPEFMRGVINLRGSVVPVIDLRLKFGMEQTPQGVNTCIIITEVDMDGVLTVLGALADSVQEVLDITPEQIEPAPRIGTSLNTQFIKGMGKHNDEFVILLNIDRVFSCGELKEVQQGEHEEHEEKDVDQYEDALLG